MTFPDAFESAFKRTWTELENGQSLGCFDSLQRVGGTAHSDNTCHYRVLSFTLASGEKGLVTGNRMGYVIVMGSGEVYVDAYFTRSKRWDQAVTPAILRDALIRQQGIQEQLDLLLR